MLLFLSIQKKKKYLPLCVSCNASVIRGTVSKSGAGIVSGDANISGRATGSLTNEFC